MKLYNNIRKYRNKLGMQRWVLAKLMGVHPTMVSKWETQINQPHPDKHDKLARALKTTQRRLFTLENPIDISE